MRKAYAISSLLRIAVIAIALFAFAAVLEASDNFTVNYNTNQSITAFSTCKKVTNNSGTGLSVYVPMNSPEEWLSFYTNPPVGVSIGSCSVAITLVSQSNANLCTLAGNPTGPGTYVFTIPAGTVIDSNSTGVAALTTGTCWSAGSTVTIVNNGAIYGRGGDGGRGSGTSNCQASDTIGGQGGPAISMTYPLTINTTNGSIFGGGGGGGGGGSGQSKSGAGGGGGGGGGQGSVSSSGGAGGSAAYPGSPGGSGTVANPGAGGRGGAVLPTYVGGTGGTWGSDGASGFSSSSGASICLGRPGGVGGAAIQSNGNTITWQGGNDATHIKGAVQ